ncbi:MAG: DUF1360 domain-containing protein [Propionibacteriales bacterium]|nr:DUF1360 domain-containing protein [Propionibacteriales bacterium]
MKLRSSGDSVLDVLFDVLATYRLTTLVKDDKITEDLRNIVWRRYGEPSAEDSHKLSYLLTCPWCLSIYFGAGAVLGRAVFPRTWGAVSRALTYSALTGLLSERRR